MKGRMRRYNHAMIVTGILVGAVAIGAIADHQAPNNRVLHTIVLHGQAYDLAIDARAHRAVVIGVTAGIPFMGYASTIDTVTGHLVRTVTLSPNPTDLAGDERTGRVFITDIGDGTVSVLDARSGALLRTVTVGEMQPHDLRRIAVDARTDRVFVSSSPVTMRNPALSAVHMLDARTGAVLRTTMTGGGSLAVDALGGQAFVANLTGNNISVLDGHTGTRARTIALGAGTGALRLAADERTGRVFVATDEGLRVIDARTERVLRAIPLPGVRNDALEVDQGRGRVIVVDGRNVPPYASYLRILDARTGALLRATAVPDVYPVVLDRRWGRVILGTANRVRAFDVRTGALLWTFAGSVATQGAIAVDERTGHVFVVDRGVMDSSGAHIGAGSVIVLDGRTGARQSVTPVGVYAGPLMIDEQTGHAIVVNDGGVVRASDAWGWIPAGLRQHLPFLPPPTGTRTVDGSVSVLDATH
jgi:DNA-binding beta-propeller fold protein YncE